MGDACGRDPATRPQATGGACFPNRLEPTRRAERALLAVVQAACVKGVRTHKVDDLLQTLGLTDIDRPAPVRGARESRVSCSCQELDELVEGFRSRPLLGAYPYLWVDALCLKVRHTVPVSSREDHRIASQALIEAIGARDTWKANSRAAACLTDFQSA